MCVLCPVLCFDFCSVFCTDHDALWSPGSGAALDSCISPWTRQTRASRRPQRPLPALFSVVPVLTRQTNLPLLPGDPWLARVSPRSVHSQAPLFPGSAQVSLVPGHSGETQGSVLAKSSRLSRGSSCSIQSPHTWRSIGSVAPSLTPGPSRSGGSSRP